MAYLRQGSVLVAANGPSADDLLDPSLQYVSGQDLLTDGQWLWPEELAYYVEKYHVRMEEEFVSYAAARHYEQASLTHDELGAIPDSFLEQFGPGRGTSAEGGTGS